MVEPVYLANVAVGYPGPVLSHIRSCQLLRVPAELNRGEVARLRRPD